MTTIFVSLCCILLCSATVDSHENSSLANVTSGSTIAGTTPTRSIAPRLPVQLNYSTNIEQLLDIWNPILLIPVWNNRDSRDVKISTKCDDEVTRFLKALASGSSWALKMLDASGRHAWGLFSGSKYWMGASDQCREMENLFVDSMKKNRSNERQDVPPFRVCVNAVRLELDILESEINGTHDIVLGVCMPAGCRPDDVAELLRYSTNGLHPNLPREVTIDHVRNLSEGYSLWDDTIFYVIL